MDQPDHVNPDIHALTHELDESPFPPWVRKTFIVTSFIHDCSILCTGVAAYLYTPFSVSLTLGPVEWVWISMLFMGAVLGIYGSILRATVVELVGCILMASGLFTWAVSAVTQPNATLTSAAVAAAFFAGGTAIIWRLIAVLVGRFLRVRN